MSSYYKTEAKKKKVATNIWLMLPASGAPQKAAPAIYIDSIKMGHGKPRY